MNQCASQTTLRRGGAGVGFAAGLLFALTQAVFGEETLGEATPDAEAPEERSFMRGWRLAIHDLEPRFVDEFDLASDQVSPRAVAYAFDRFIVLDSLCRFGPCAGPGKAFAYTPDGQRDPDSDFALAPRISWSGATYANGLLYVVGLSLDTDTVFAYTERGERATAADFELDRRNYNPRGIVHVDGHFYVLDSGQDSPPRRAAKVYVYTTAGVRVPAAEFGLGLHTRDFPHEITYVDGLFYIAVIQWVAPGWVEPRPPVLIYRPDGERLGGLPFPQAFIDGMTFVNEQFHVLSGFGVCAYTLKGERVAGVEERWCGRDVAR